LRRIAKIVPLMMRRWIGFAFAWVWLTAPLALAADSAPSDAKDISVMIRIPAGPFLMGSNDGPDDERPQHKVSLPEFFIDRTKVTNGQFAVFLNAVGPRGHRGANY
jgi:formylglycine-generating enzyme required for sulfatase activity